MKVFFFVILSVGLVPGISFACDGKKQAEASSDTEKNVVAEIVAKEASTQKAVSLKHKKFGEKSRPRVLYCFKGK